MNFNSPRDFNPRKEELADILEYVVNMCSRIDVVLIQKLSRAARDVSDRDLARANLFLGAVASLGLFHLHGDEEEFRRRIREGLQEFKREFPALSDAIESVIGHF